MKNDVDSSFLGDGEGARSRVIAKELEDTPLLTLVSIPRPHPRHRKWTSLR